MPDYDMQDLVRRAQAREPQALSALYDLHYRHVYAFAYYRLNGNVALAEDVTSEVFLRAFRSIRSFRWKGASFKTWLLTIARNHVIDLTRRLPEMPLDESWLDDSASPAELAERAFDQGELVKALDTLTMEQREAIVLRFLEDLSIADTASIMGKTPDAVKRLQARGLAALRREMTKNTNVRK